ncbi:MAG: hypothetical protein FD164_2183 [Nitrospirae bacterium]|nr:MAG: hypothetical protein FD164_2183 [Nitrospirota bacterium]
MSQTPPPLVHYLTEDEYYQHFCNIYCNKGTVMTFDGIRVDFYPGNFKHAFRESANRQKGDKSVFSSRRAQRIDWIKWALEHTTAELFRGWNKNIGTYDPERRVCIVVRNYIVVIQFKDIDRAFFITAYPADSDILRKIRNGPRWR